MTLVPIMSLIALSHQNAESVSAFLTTLLRIADTDSLSACKPADDFRNFSTADENFLDVFV